MIFTLDKSTPVIPIHYTGSTYTYPKNQHQESALQHEDGRKHKMAAYYLFRLDAKNLLAVTCGSTIDCVKMLTPVEIAALCEAENPTK